MPVHTIKAFLRGDRGISPIILKLWHHRGVCGCLHGQATLPLRKNPSHHSLCGHIMKTWCPDWVWEIQTTGWCYEDHTWGTQLLVVLENTQLNLINFINITIHPSVKPATTLSQTRVICIPTNRDIPGIRIAAKNIQGVTGETDQTSRECSLC